MKETVNTAVLVIDDEEMVRDNIEEILVPKKAGNEHENINLAAEILFNKPQSLLVPRTSNIPHFTVDKAINGMEGLELVKKSIEAGKPYAVIFLDMRMPGWDGLETAIQIRKFDSRAEIIFVTAFSDRSIDEIVEQAGQNVGYHCKPYASEEIIQLATKAVTDYNKLRNLEKLIDVISSISLNEQQLNSVLHNILDQLATFMDTDMALLGKLHNDYSYEKIFSIGALEEKINMQELIVKVKTSNIKEDEILQIEEVVLARLENYTIFAMLKKQEKLKTEKLYLLRLFVQNAAKAIRNAELNEKLSQREKLSAAGKAISMVMHDLRSPIKNIRILTNQMREENIKSEWLDLIDKCSNQASEIFDDFLDFIKETSIKKQPLNLSAIIDESIQPNEKKHMDQGLHIYKDVPSSLIMEGDPSKLKRVIMNLINNATDALIDFNIPNPEIYISAVPDMLQKQVIITIKDNGPGIPAEISKTLFEPFVTLKKISNGTGLGLAIVKQYIIAHGGTVSVESNSGAIFTIILPIG